MPSGWKLGRKTNNLLTLSGKLNSGEQLVLPSQVLYPSVSQFAYPSFFGNNSNAVADIKLGKATMKRLKLQTS